VCEFKRVVVCFNGFLNWELYWDEWSVSQPSRLSPRYPLNRYLSGSHWAGRFGEKRKLLSVLGIEPRFFRLPDVNLVTKPPETLSKNFLILFWNLIAYIIHIRWQRRHFIVRSFVKSLFKYVNNIALMFIVSYCPAWWTQSSHFLLYLSTLIPLVAKFSAHV
jgi:hypothetical protein